MDKQQSQAIAAVICRVVDCYHARAGAERMAVTGPDASAQAARLIDAQDNIAQALEALDEDELGEAHQVG
jgi:hypothetical protein